MQNDENYTDIRLWLGKHGDFLANSSVCENKLFDEVNGIDVAIVSEITFLKSLQKKHCQNIKTVLLTDRFYPGYFAFAFPKQSPLNAVVSMEY